MILTWNLTLKLKFERQFGDFKWTAIKSGFMKGDERRIFIAKGSFLRSVQSWFFGPYDRTKERWRKKGTRIGGRGAHSVRFSRAYTRYNKDLSGPVSCSGSFFPTFPVSLSSVPRGEPGVKTDTHSLVILSNTPWLHVGTEKRARGKKRQRRVLRREGCIRENYRNHPVLLTLATQRSNQITFSIARSISCLSLSLSLPFFFFS